MSNLVPGAYAQKDALGGQPNVAIPYVVPAFVASSLGSGTDVVGESVTKGAVSGVDALANVASGSGLLRSIARVTDRTDGVANYKEGTHYQLTNDMIDWSIRPLMTSPTQDTAVASMASGTVASGSYYYAVTVRNNASGESSWVTGQAFASAALASAGQIQLGWAAVDNGLDYRVYRTDTLTDTYPDFSVSGGGLLATVTGGTTYLDDGTDSLASASVPSGTNTAGDEPLNASTYTVDYTHSTFTFNEPKKFRSLDDVIRDHGFGSQAAIMSEFAMSTVPGRGNSAPAVWIVAAGSDNYPTRDPLISEYQTALGTLDTIEDDQLVVVVGKNSSEIRSSLKTHVANMSALEVKKNRVGIVYADANTAIGSSAVATSILGIASDMADSRIIMAAVDSGSANGDVQDNSTGVRSRIELSPEYWAAAIAGRIASLTDSAEPLTRKSISGLFTHTGTINRQYNTTELRDLRDGGVAVLDFKSDSNWLMFQGVTTDTAIADNKEISVVLASDTLAFAWRDAIDPNPNTSAKASLIGSKLTDGLLQAVKNRTIFVFDDLTKNSIIRDYDPSSIVVVQNAQDQTQIDVTATYRPIYPANVAILTFSTSFSLQS